MKKNTKLRFKRKSYGRGRTPITREGWVVLLVYVAYAIFRGLTLEIATTQMDIYIGVSALFLATVLVVYISNLKGEDPKWQWGEKTKE